MMTEYDAFKVLTEALAKAAEAARLIAYFRPDQAQKWMKMAEVYSVAREAAFRLAGTGVQQ